MKNKMINEWERFISEEEKDAVVTMVDETINGMLREFPQDKKRILKNINSIAETIIRDMGQEEIANTRLRTQCWNMYQFGKIGT